MPARIAKFQVLTLCVGAITVASLPGVLFHGAAMAEIAHAVPHKQSQPQSGTDQQGRTLVPLPPKATVDLRHMHYGHAANAPLAVHVDLPPAAKFPEKLKLEIATKNSPPVAAARALATGTEPERKTIRASQADKSLPVASLSRKTPIQIELPPPAPVQINRTDVAGYSPAAEALRELLEPALKSARIRAGKRIRGKKARRAWRRKVARTKRELGEFAKFYADRRYSPIWHSEGKWSDQARSVLTRLSRAGDDALELGIKTPALSAVSREAKAIAAADLEISRAVVRYARYARSGSIDPRRVSALITVKRNIPAIQPILRDVSAAEFAGDALRAYNPAHAGYIALRKKLAELRSRGDRKKLPPIAFGRTLRIGMRDARVPLIRLRFGVSASDERRETLYDTRVASAVAKFQRSRGLAANGRLSRSTIRALSRNNRKRLIHDIIANMERWRWLPVELGKTHIMVNVPEYQMKLIRNGQQIHSARVIVGKKKTPTPVFSDLMRYIVVNPYWNVPASIIKNEMLPAFDRDPAYFSRRGYEVKRVGERLVVRQPPGPRNALGYIKFLFPNRHAVYLHDTPGRHKFKYSSRALSHGCVRVQDPFKLAGIILSGQRGWSERRLRRMVGGKERTIRMKHRLPIHIVYFTASVDESGELIMRRDLYGFSRRLKSLMGLRG